VSSYIAWNVDSRSYLSPGGVPYFDNAFAVRHLHGPDLIADKVIEIDDPLFDSRVMFIAESALLNEAG
jgi:hypothetical protein